MNKTSKIYCNTTRVLCIIFLLPLFSGNLSSQPVTLSVEIIDAGSSKPTPVRIKLVDEQGHVAPVSKNAIGVMYGRNDAAEGYVYQPDSAFYVDGAFEVELQPGKYQLSISKGFEYLQQNHMIDLTTQKLLSEKYELKRWINMPSEGWYSADDHIHIRRSPRENPYIIQWIAAEDIHIGAMLQMGDFYTTYFAQYAFGNDGLYREENNIIMTGQEDPRTHEVGHTILLTANNKVRFIDQYYLYDSVFDKVHEYDGLTGYAHQGMSFHGYRGMTLDVLRGKVDFLELLQFCVENGPLHLEHYYHYLDLGYKIIATAGSDFPWCGIDASTWDAQIGNARFYTYVGKQLTFDAWKKAFKAGHTFVSSGPMLDLKVNDLYPGATLDTRKGTILKIEASAFGHKDQVPLEQLEIVALGEVIKSIDFTKKNQSQNELHMEMEVPVERGMWISARCKAGSGQWAHTTPVYVHVDELGHLNSKTAPKYLELSEKYLQELEEVIQRPHKYFDRRAWTYKDALQIRIDEARAILNDIGEKLE